MQSAGPSSEGARPADAKADPLAGAPAGSVSPAGKVLFYAAVVALTALALTPLWIFRLLPMQDYPEQLFFSKAVATYTQPGFDWSAHYLVDLSIRPYALWYLAMKPLTAWFGVEAAGRMMMSLYVMLIAVLVLVARRLSPRGTLPWAALLLFPLAFNQMYFMGFMNYILAIPFLFLLLIDLEAMSAAPFRAGRLLRHALGLTLLLLAHPYALLIYVGLAGAAALASLPERAVLRRMLTPALFVVVGLAGYYITRLSQPDQQARTGDVRWWSLESIDAYYLLMFTGMRWINGADVLCLLLWLSAAGALLFSWRRHGRQARNPRPMLFMFLASSAGFLVLPFWYLYYSYLNVRLAPVAYFALALLAARLLVGVRAGAVVAGCAALLTMLSLRDQKNLSLETGEILPVLAKMPRNQLLLPLLFDTSSQWIDGAFFQEFHLHDPSYYHALVGGGATPTLMEHPLGPVHYRPNISLPAPAVPEAFNWYTHGTQYDYILTRAAPEALISELRQHAEESARSGPWVLFHNPNGPASTRRRQP